MKKKLIVGVLVASMSLMSSVAMAKTGMEKVDISYNDMKIYVGDNQLKEIAEPFVLDGKTYIGIEDLVKYLNYEMQKDETGKIVKLVEKAPVIQGMTKEKENNDTYTQANPISINSSITGAIGQERSKGDTDRTDYFKIVIPQDGELDVKFVGTPGLNIYMELLGEDGGSIIDLSTGADRQLSVTKPLQKGIYYIRIRQMSKAGTYTITNTFTPQDIKNDVEVNDSFQVALPYELNTTVTGHIGYINSKKQVDNQDWYKLSLSQSKQVTFLLEATKNTKVELYVYKEDASTLVGWSTGVDRQLSVNKSLEAGTYYIAVKTMSSAGDYTLETK